MSSCAFACHHRVFLELQRRMSAQLEAMPFEKGAAEALLGWLGCADDSVLCTLRDMLHQGVSLADPFVRGNLQVQKR